MATSEEIKNALIGQLATFNGSSTEAEAMTSENIGKIYVPTDEDVIIINKRRVGCGRNATTEKDGLMSTTDKKNFDEALIHLDSIDKQLAEIPNDYATKTELNAVDTKTTTASTNATNALSKVNNIINGTTVIPSATNAQNAQTATNLTGKPVFAKGTTNTNAVTVTVGGQKSTEFTVPYATNAGNATTADSATKATNDGSGNNIVNTYATKEEVEADFTAVNNSLAIASSTATEALGKANYAKGKVDNIISGTTVVPTATNAQEAQKATQDGGGNEITKTYATKAELKTTNDSLGTTAATANDAKSKVDKIISGGTKAGKAAHADTATTAKNLEDAPYLQDGDNNSIKLNVGGKTSNSYIVPYATTADKATKDGSGNNIVNTYATKEELNDKLNASDAMVLAGSISGKGVIQKHNDNVVSQNVKDGTTNISALTDYKAGWTWRVVSDGTITDIGKVESGDMVMCVSDYKSAYKASDWTAIQRNIDLATSNSSGLMSATDKANLDAALIQLDGIDTKISNIEGDITNIENDLTNTYATKTEMGAVEDKADAAQSTANEAKSIANSLVNGTTKAKEAETADSATKATQDGNGNVIDDTYALRGEAVATQDLGKYVPVNKHTGGTLAFPLATQSAGGAMSSDDKKKLDDAEGTYYSSFNVTGSGWYRLVNVPLVNWLDKYLVVDIVAVAGEPVSNSFKIYYNSPKGWGDERNNSFICAPLTRTNTQCVGDVRLVYKGGAPAQYIDAYIILPKGTTNLSVSIKSNIDAKYLAKNPVGADGKEGVAEAVLIALPEGYSSIKRNAYVGYLTSDNPRRVVGGLYSERSLQDINGNRIDEQYATKTEMNSYLPETLANGGYINTLQEGGNAHFIPFLQNEFAHLIERGGSVSVAINGTEYTRGDNVAVEATERKNFFDGCNSYYQIWSSSLGLQDTVTITINLPNSYIHAGTIYCLMPNAWRGRNVKFELFYPSLNNGAGEWHTMYEGTNLRDGLVYQPIKTLYDANGNVLVPVNIAWTKLRVTMTNFIATDITLRIAEIGYVSYASKNSTAICLPRNGGEIYGGIIPLNNSSYDLGANGKAWKNVFADMLTSKGADVTGFVTLNHKSAATKSGIIWKNFRTAEANGWANDILVFKGKDDNKYWTLGEYGFPEGLQYMYFGKNGYDGENFRFYNNGQFKIPVADGTAPLVVSSKTMVANLNAEMVGGFKHQYRVGIVGNVIRKIMTIKILTTGLNSPVTFDINGRSAKNKASVSIFFNGAKTLSATAVDSFTYYGDGSYPKVLRIYDTGDSVDNDGNVIAKTFEIWTIKKVTSWGSFTISNIHHNMDYVGTKYIDIILHSNEVADSEPAYTVYKDCTVANMDVIASSSKMLMGGSNAPLNVGNYFTPVYFNGGVPTSCSVLNNNKNFGGIPYVSDAGNFPIGKMLQFHMTSDEDTNKNANLRITARDANDADGAGLTIGGNTIASGKFAQHSGYICCNTASLSSYWGKLWSTKWNTKQDNLDVTIYIHSAYSNRRGIVHLNVRFEAKKNEDGTYTEGSHSIVMNQIVGNLTASSFRLYYKCDVNASTGTVTKGQIELWCNVAGQYGVYNAVLLSATSRVYKEHTNYYGTFSQTIFTTVQTPTLPNYVEMTNVTISQTAAKALAADKAIYLRTVNNTNADTDFPILWGGGDTLNVNEVYSTIYRSYNDLSYNPSKKRITTGLFRGCIESVAIPTTDAYSLQYVSRQLTLGDEAGNAKEGSNADPNLWSYPKGETYVSSTNANIQTLRFRWNDTYFHDLFMSPNYPGLWHRHINNGAAGDWMKIVEATEGGKVVIEGTTYEDTLRIKNKDRSTGEIHIFNGEQGNAVIRHYEGSQATDLKFNSTQVMHGSKILAYSSDVTALQTEIANLKKTVLEQATLIEALQSALTWE